MISVINKKLVKVTESKAVTFKVEDLSEPDCILEETTLDKLFSNFSNRIIAHSEINDKLVSNGFHSFLYGMYQAYYGHRPFILSPDMIWLVICQGFATHIKFGKGTENDVFPHLNTKQDLVIAIGEDEKENELMIWEKLPNRFSTQIGKILNNDLLDILKANFTTTTSAERIACEITILDTMKPYFEYVPLRSICGIPAITLEGSEDDWLKILNKLSKFRKYNLNWWVDKLEPIINEFVLAIKGKKNKRFWKNMFKNHSSGRGCMDGELVNGWIMNFYPYDKHGKLTNFKNMRSVTNIERIMAVPFKSVCDELPKEIVCVDFDFETIDEEGNVLSSIPMEYWAGFVGLKQDKASFALRPEIGWFVCQKDETIKNGNPHVKNGEHDSRKYFNLVEFPTEVLSIPKWYQLALNFKNEIVLPDDILKLSMKWLVLSGKMQPETKSLISKLMDKGVGIYFNGKEYKMEASH